MKKLNKLLSIISSIAMVFMMAVPTVTVNAAATGTTGTITINAPSSDVSIDGKTFTAYKILDAKYDSSNKDNVTYTVPATPTELKNFYASWYNTGLTDGQISTTDSDFDAKIVAKIAGLNGDDDALQAFAKAMLAKINELNASAKAAEKPENEWPVRGYSAVASRGSATIDGVPFGYYVIADTTAYDPNDPDDPDSDYVVAAVALNTTNPEAEVSAKIGQPTVTKSFNDATKSKAKSFDIDKPIQYRIEAKIPEDVTGYETYTYIITDVLSEGLTMIDGTVDGVNMDPVVEIYNSVTANDLASDVPLQDNNVTVKLTPDETGTQHDYSYTKTAPATEGEGKTTLKFDFHKILQYVREDGYGGKYIVITYWAKLNGKAVIASTGNPNDVHLTYSNNPNQSGSGNPSTTDTPDHKVTAFTFEINVDKVDGDVAAKNAAIAAAKAKKEAGTEELSEEEEKLAALDESKAALAGVEFKLFKLADNENPSTSDKLYAKVEDLSASGNISTNVDSGSADAITWTHMVGTTETINDKDYGTTFVTDSNGKINITGLEAGTYYLEEITPLAGYNLIDGYVKIVITDSYTVNDSTGVITDKTFTLTQSIVSTDFTTEKNSTTLDPNPSEGSDFVVTVANNGGELLPGTGGLGTKLLYSFGAIILLAAAVFLATNRRMRAEM